MRRRGFVGGALASVIASSCGDSDDGLPPTDDPACPGLANLPCDDDALGALTTSIMETDRADIVALASAHLHAGVSVEDLFYAGFSAGIRASSFRTHSNHTCKMVESARQLSLGATGPDRYVPLMWSLHLVSPCPDGIQDGRQTGGPMGSLDETNMPMGTQAAAALDQAMVDYDREGAERAVVALFRSGDLDGVRNALYRWAPRNSIPNGHWAIQVAQYLRIVEQNQWRCVEPVLRHMVVTLATPYYATENPSLWASGEQAFVANRARAETIASTWPDGAVDDAAAAELCVAFRTLDWEGAGQLVADRLAGGLAPRSIWDAILLNRAEIVLASPGTMFDEHCVTSVTALYDLYQAASDPDAKLLLLLQAAGRYVGRWSTTADTVLASLGPIEPPASAEEILEGLDASHQHGSFSAEARMKAAAQTLGWFEAGRSADDFDRAAINVIARKAGADIHSYKVTLALLENARAVGAAFGPRIRAALMLYTRAPSDTDWDRYEEVMSAVADLPA